MRLNMLSIGVATIALAAAAPANSAQAVTAQPPAALQRVTDCRAVADSAERLACYDREVAALAAATASNEVVVVDREQVRKTRRSLFGLSLPNLGVFTGDDDELPQIDTQIVRASQNAYRKWTFVLADGSVWAQTDGNLRLEPKPGHEIRIRKAALGSYLANIHGHPGIRVQRVR